MKRQVPATKNTKGTKTTKTTLCIEGMHCASCEVLLERRLKKVPGVTKASAQFAKGTIAIEHEKPLSTAALHSAIDRDGYTLLEGSHIAKKPLTRADYLQIGAIFLVLIGAYFLLKQFNFLPDIAITDNMGLGVVFIIGLIAATSSCLAVTGGLLLALAASYSERHPNLTGVQKFKPAAYFNIGRVIGYTAFGALLGAIGGLFTFSPSASGILTIIAASVMIILGLQMLRLLPFLDRMQVKMPKFIAHAIHDKANGTYKPWAPFVLGAGTFFVPCGFTQALQFYVLAKGSALVGATTMLAFSLGTFPMLMLVGAASSFSTGKFHAWFIRIATALVILLGILSLSAGITLVSM